MRLSKKKQKKNNPLWLLLLIVVSVLLIGGLFTQKDSIKNISPKPSSPEVKAIVNTPYVSASGISLYLNGKSFKFTGVNAYSLGTFPGVNAGCGAEIKDIDGFFGSLRPNSVVRTWAFQGGISTNAKTKKIDWAPLDRIVNSADRNKQKVILVFTGQGGTCDDGHWKDQAWYSGGYTKSFNDDGRGLAPLSYIDYVKLVVDRYKNSTAIAMWELVNEPEASNCASGFKGDGCYTHQQCTDRNAAREALRKFHDTVGAAIKNIDKNHIIESGVIGTGQCGAIHEDYAYLHQSSYIDVASFHDYGEDDKAMPGDQWNGLQKRLNQMKTIQKPLIIGESGMLAVGPTSPKCLSLNARRDKFKAKMDVQFAAGIAGFLPWDWTGGQSKICNFDIGDNDPTMALLHDYPL